MESRVGHVNKVVFFPYASLFIFQGVALWYKLEGPASQLEMMSSHANVLCEIGIKHEYPGSYKLMVPGFHSGSRHSLIDVNR